MASFLGGATASNVYWNILGFDSISADRIITTASIGYDMGNGKISNMTVAELRTVTGIGQGYLANVNAVLTGAADTLNNGTASFVSADTGFAGDSTFGTNIGATSVDFNTAANLGNSMGFFMISETSASAAATTRVTNLQFADRVWNLATDGTLTYAAAAPVPEADTYALMLAGLGLVGFLARRRKAA